MNTLNALLLLVAMAQLPTDKTKVAEYLQTVSVTVQTSHGSGSGVVINKGEDTFILTAAHVISSLRTVREVVVDGETKKKIDFVDPTVMQVNIQDGRSVGKVEFFCRVVKYSESENGHDLALLLVRKKKAFDKMAVFKKDEVPVGSDLFHCGSLLGEQGSNSITRGTFSQHGRLFNNRILDQVQVSAFPGSSGGGVYMKDTGEMIGVLVRGAGEGFNLIVPNRRIFEWAKESKVEWLFNDDKVPDLNNVSVE